MLALFVSLELAKLVFSRADTSFALDSQAFAQEHSLWEIVTNLPFLQSFGLHSGLTCNGVAWSAALEFYVSILFAVIVLLFPRRLYDVFLGLCVAAGLLLYTVSPNTLFVNTDWGILRVAFGFFAGCLVYDLRLRSGDRLKAPNLWEACCLVLVVAFAVTTPPRWMRPDEACRRHAGLRPASPARYRGCAQVRCGASAEFCAGAQDRWSFQHALRSSSALAPYALLPGAALQTLERD
jgi:peptidoglycan/LPS O-acetylase OafA/YrhL